MSNEVFQLFTLTRSLAENVELAEALSFAEISALAETERKRRLALGAKDFQRGPAGFREHRQASEIREHFTPAVRKFLRPGNFQSPRCHCSVQLPHAGRHSRDCKAAFGTDPERRDGLGLRPIDGVIRPEVAEHLAMRGYDERYGARPLQRAIERLVVTPLARWKIANVNLPKVWRGRGKLRHGLPGDG